MDWMPGGQHPSIQAGLLQIFHKNGNKNTQSTVDYTKRLFPDFYSDVKDLLFDTKCISIRLNWIMDGWNEHFIGKLLNK